MTRFALVAALTATLLSFSTGVYATCLACPNCISEGCLYSWTCSGATITCNYPSSANPGTYDGCVFTGTPTGYGYYEFLQTGGPAVCDGIVIGDNSKCEPYNNPWNVPGEACTSSGSYVGEPGSK
ncbi:hypothetical protein J3R82DRAFT_7236 [Butyriboletus roseoflavus]|nr:hypothetical protein J3R82DRAFT_7236 [Butyriboletus roseoflavus]